MRFSISSIEITNFRLYKGTQIVRFTSHPTKNVIIVKGENAVGKSTLLNALTWCLYDVESQRPEARYDSGERPIINSSVFDALSNYDSTYAEVKIIFDTEVGDITVTRRLEGGKGHNGERWFDKSKLTIVHPVRGQDKVDTSPEQTQKVINNLLPESLKQFFFIDGEELRSLFNYPNPQKIADAIHSVSQLGRLRNAAKNLELLESHLRKGVKETSPNIQKIQKNITKVEKEIREDKEELSAREDDCRKDREEREEIETYLRNHSSVAVRQLEEERDVIKADVTDLIRLKGDKEAERDSYLAEVAPFIFLRGPISSTLDLISGHMKRGQLPPDTKDILIPELLEEGVCICGTTLTSELRKTLEKYRNDLPSSEAGIIAMDGKTVLEGILNDIKLFSDKIESVNNEIDKYAEMLARKEERLETISQILKESDKTEISRREERKIQLDRFISENETSIRVLNSRIDAANPILKKLRKDEGDELSKSDKNRELLDKLKIVQEGIAVLEEFETIAKANIKEQVENNTHHNFLAMVGKKRAYKRVTIDDNYLLKVHSEGEEEYSSVSDLSAGEQMILGLSFMSALMTISGFNAPVIIDTPLGRLGPKARESVTTELPQFLRDTQLVLFVTPTEYDPQVKANLAKFLLPENYFEIELSEDETESAIRTIG